MECTVCNDSPGEVSVVALEQRDGTVKELEFVLCDECETGLCVEDWIEIVGTPAEV